MGISMLGADLFEGLNKIIGGIGNLVMKALFVILGPLLETLVSIIMGLLSYLFYIISTFLLALIDFVELLFRLLAGLDVEGVHMSYNGGEGDLLVQIIRSEEVTQAFLAVAIVGVFLLIITTVFQMIRVEYTTEGSKNAKGPILEKAFRGLCNLMLIPILSIFGILIGNEILQLLDTATSGAEGASISGQLWVTAASDAYYTTEDDKEKYKIEEDEVLNPIVPIINMAVENGKQKANDKLDKPDDKTTAIKPSVKIEMENEEVRNGFLTGGDGYDIYNIVEVTNYYNITKINYFMLIFGACIIIKTLYHAAFGMVNRLYRCIAYFIVSPIAVGMTPINEGNMGTWRKKFLGLVISAYGVIVSLNLFLVITDILMSVEFSFDSANLGGFTQILGTYAMEGLIKCIFIIVGALMIEKLSGDFVGYFGGEDALSAGKGLAGETTQMATKAISTAVTGAAVIGTGGAAAMGLAGKLGKGALNVGGKIGGKLANTKLGQKIGDGANRLGNKMKDSDLGRFAQKGYDKFSGTKFGKKTIEKASKAKSSFLSWSGVGAGDREKSLLSMTGDQDYTLKLLDQEDAFKKQQFENGDISESDYKSFLNDDDRKKRRSTALKERSAITSSDEYKKLSEQVTQDRQVDTNQRQKQMVRTSSLAEFAKSNLEGTFFGKGYKQSVDSWHKIEQQGTSYSDQGKAAYEVVSKERSDAKSKLYDTVHHGDIKAMKTTQQMIIMQQIMESMTQSTKENDAAINKLDKAIEELTNAIKDDNGNVRTNDADVVGEKGGQYSTWTVGQVKGYINDKQKERLQLSNVKLDPVDIKLKLESAIKSGKALDEKALLKVVEDYMSEKGAEGNKKMLDEFKKIIQDVLSKQGGSK